MHGEGHYIDADRVSWIGVFIKGNFQSRIQKRLIEEKKVGDRIEAYKQTSLTLFVQFAEAFLKSDKKTFKENLSPFVATTETCGEFVAEPFTKYDERAPDKWNEIFKIMQE